MRPLISSKTLPQMQVPPGSAMFSRPRRHVEMRTHVRMQRAEIRVRAGRRKREGEFVLGVERLRLEDGKPLLPASPSGEGLAGLRTTLFPNARAGAAFHAGMAMGKFQGVIRTQTPSGNRRV